MAANETMNECRTRKEIQHQIFWNLWNRAKKWVNTNPVEKLDYFKDVVFHVGMTDSHQTYIGFNMNVPEFDGDSWYIGRWSFTWDKNMDTPVMLHFHSLRENAAYYLKSDNKTFWVIEKDNGFSMSREICDKRTLKIAEQIMGIQYDRRKNRFTIMDQIQ